MKFLGLNTSNARLSLVLFTENGKVLKRQSYRSFQRHAASLVPRIRRFLEGGRRPSAALRGIVVGVGPGSFTGLRVGVVTAATLARLWKIPVFGVNTLEAMAYGRGRTQNQIAAVLNAKRGQCYAAIYEAGPRRLRVRLRPSLWTVEKFLKRIRRPTDFVGEDMDSFAEQIKKFRWCRRWETRSIGPAEIARAACDGRLRSPRPAFRPAPLYLYGQDCNVVLPKRRVL